MLQKYKLFASKQQYCLLLNNSIDVQAKICTNMNWHFEIVQICYPKQKKTASPLPGGGF